MKKLSLVLILALPGLTNSCLPAQKPTEKVCVVDYDIDRDYAYVIAEFEKNCELLTEDLSLSAKHPIYALLKLKQSPSEPRSFDLKTLYVQGAPAGFVFYYYLEITPELLYKFVNIQWLAVNEAHRGKGYSKLLLDAACADLKKNGFTKAALTTGIDNHRAQKLYTSFGFTQAKRCDKHMHYVKDLN